MLATIKHSNLKDIVGEILNLVSLSVALFITDRSIPPYFMAQRIDNQCNSYDVCLDQKDFL